MLASRFFSAECRAGGQHVARTARLRITTARWTDILAAVQLIRDPQAQHWQGWGPQNVLGQVSTLPGEDPWQVSREYHYFVAFEATTGQLLVSIDIHRRLDGSYDIGGNVDPDRRGRGYGTEALEAICRLAHQHLGITRLHAACESTNLISRRWLAACQFVAADGVAAYMLPNGRTADCVWWLREDHRARRRCRLPLL